MCPYHGVNQSSQILFSTISGSEDQGIFFFVPSVSSSSMKGPYLSMIFVHPGTAQAEALPSVDKESPMLSVVKSKSMTLPTSLLRGTSSPQLPTSTDAELKIHRSMSDDLTPLTP